MGCATKIMPDNTKLRVNGTWWHSILPVVVGIRVGLQARYLIVRLEGGLDVLDGVLKVEDVGTVLARTGPIETRKRLHGL